MSRWHRGGVGVGLVLVVGLCCASCSSPYMKNRADDAKDAMDFGITTSSKPCFALYVPGDYFNFTPFGYSNVKGTFHGVGNRRVGSMPIVDQSWGVLLRGSKKICVGEFDPNEPRHVSPATVAELKTAGKPAPTEPARYADGALGLLCRRDALPPASFYT